jgi:hypothetical protein
MAQATDSTTSTNSAPALKHHHGNGEERKAMMKILGLSKEDLKDLTPKERQAKVKETAQKYVTDMKAKKASGALTEEQEADLAKVEKFLAHSGHKKAANTASN